MSACPKCHGKGYDPTACIPYADGAHCWHCNGTGQVTDQTTDLEPRIDYGPPSLTLQVAELRKRLEALEARAAAAVTALEGYDTYLQAMGNVRRAMQSGAEPSATECCIDQYVHGLRLAILRLGEAT